MIELHEVVVFELRLLIDICLDSMGSILDSIGLIYSLSGLNELIGRVTGLKFVFYFSFDPPSASPLQVLQAFCSSFDHFDI